MTRFSDSVFQHRSGNGTRGYTLPLGEYQPQTSAAQGAAVGTHNTVDPKLQAIVDRWPELPDAVKSGVLAMVSATVASDQKNTR